jgi:hypothetical protein
MKKLVLFRYDPRLILWSSRAHLHHFPLCVAGPECERSLTPPPHIEIVHLKANPEEVSGA